MRLFNGLFVLPALLLVVCIVPAQTQNMSQFTSHWAHAAAETQSATGLLAYNLQHRVVPSSQQDVVTSNLDQCINDITNVYRKNTTSWLEMIIYSGRFPGDYGNYLECQDLAAAHFCVLKYAVSNVSTVLLSTGLCVPVSCSSKDLVQMIDNITDPTWIPHGVTTSAECVPKKNPPLSTGGIITTLVISILGFIMLASTLFDLVRRYMQKPDKLTLASPVVMQLGYAELAQDSMTSTIVHSTSTSIQYDHDHHGSSSSLTEEYDQDSAHPERSHNDEKKEEKKSILVQLILCFSVAENLNKLVKHFPNSKTNLNPLNSIRVVAMMWVVLGHTVLFTLFIGYSNFNQAMKHLIPTPSFEIILNATLSVDVFFYLSGFLVTYFTLKELRQSNGRLNWIVFVLHRLWRMTPTMVLALFFCWHVAVSLGNGPWWRTFMQLTTNACHKYWWTNLLYINNFWNFDLDQTCLAWTWYMSTDMQFFLLAAPIIYLLYRWPKIGFGIIAVLTAGSLAYVIGMSVSYKLSPSVLKMDAGWQKYLYTKPYARISTFFIGVVFAYLLLDHEGQASPHGFRRLPFLPQNLLIFLGWGLGIFMTMFPVFVPYSLYQWKAPDWSAGKNVAYLTLARPCFTLGLAIMAHIVMTSRSSVSLRDALSHPIWTPFARLTFGAYLYHPIIMFGFYFSRTAPLEITGTMILVNWISFTALSFAAAFVSFLIIERPTENLEGIVIKVLKEKAKRKRRETQDRLMEVHVEPISAVAAEEATEGDE